MSTKLKEIKKLLRVWPLGLHLSGKNTGPSSKADEAIDWARQPVARILGNFFGGDGAKSWWAKNHYIDAYPPLQLKW